MSDINVSQYTCWDCANRIGEECDNDGHEVYVDSKICINFEVEE